MEDITGKQLNRYQVVAPLGEGGMAAVYKAYHPETERYVALKILPKHFASDPEFVGRFEQEAKLIAQLQHPHILPVFDYGEADDYTYIVMPFVETGTLADLLGEAPLPIEQIQRIISQVGDALDYAHSRGIVHRDVKPSNILIDERGNCLLMDFGIAKMVEGTKHFTQTGGVIGTPAYMSPEQGLGQKPDGRSDIYSLGVVLYQMATGRLPFDAETPMAVAIKHIFDPLPPPRTVNPNLSETVERVILKALTKERDDRYATAAEMIAALQAIAEDETAIPKADKVEKTEAVDSSPQAPESAQPVVPMSPAPDAPAKAKIRPLWLILGCVGLLGLVALTVGLGIFFFGPGLFASPTAPEPAPTELMEPTPLPPTTPAEPDQPADDTIFVYNAQGLEVFGIAETWEGNANVKDMDQAEIVEDPKGIFEQVAKLSVHGYGHGEQTAEIVVVLTVPSGADIISIPVATALNGHVNETDSESGLEIAVRGGDQTVWTYASFLMETQLSVPYVQAFADVSPFRGEQVELTIRLRQLDVCAGTLCTHDAEFFIGDLFFGNLPDICTTQSDGSYLLYTYYDDPTPYVEDDCPLPQPYYFMDVEAGPYNAYGAGEDTYSVSFTLPQGAQLLEFRMYYGLHTGGMTINGHTLEPDEVYAAFPNRSGLYLNIPEPSRYAPFNNNPEAIAPYLQSGENTISVTIYTKELWEERPFDLFARFQVPSE
jgi:serine/threonine-protein kinase